MPVVSEAVIFFIGRYLLLLCAFVVLGVTFARSRRAARHDAERLFEQMDIAISRMHVLEDSIAEQYLRLEQLLQSVESQTRLTAAAAGSQPPRQYETAIRLARGGSSRDELVAACGLGRHEAELLLRLHAPRAAPAETRVTESAARTERTSGPGRPLAVVG